MKITITNQERINILENTISGFVVLMMLVYGTGKIVQFNNAITIEKTLPELTGMELMWAFYGYSLPFALTIGFLEVLGGLLILFKRTRLLGCLLISIILTNVIIQDIVFEVHKGALISAIFYQLLTFIILWINKSKLIKSYKILTQKKKIKQTKKKQIAITLISLPLIVLLWFIINYSTSFLSHL